MAKYLYMDGIDDTLQIPSMTMTEIVLEIKPYLKSGTFQRYWSFPFGAELLQRTGSNVDSFSVGHSFVEVNGNRVVNNTVFVTNQIRQTIRSVFSTPKTQLTHVLSNNSTSLFLEAEIYSIKYYNGTTLVAHYDMSTGTVLDQSGNGRHATLVGGTWMGEEAPPSGTAHVLTSTINNYSDTIANLTVSKHHSLLGDAQSNSNTITTLQTVKSLRSTVQIQSTSQNYLSAVKRMLSTINSTSMTQASLTVQSVEGTAHNLQSSIKASSDVFAILHTNSGLNGESLPQSQINSILGVNKPLTSVIVVQSYTGAHLGFGEQIISYVYLSGFRELNVYLKGHIELDVHLQGKRELEIHLKGSV